MNRDERWPRRHGIRWHQVSDDDSEARDNGRVTSPTVNISVKNARVLRHV